MENDEHRNLISLTSQSYTLLNDDPPTYFRLEIEGVNLDELSVSRLAEYAEAFAKLLGVKKETIFLSHETTLTAREGE